VGNSGTGGHQGRARLTVVVALLAALVAGACGSALPTDTSTPGVVGPGATVTAPTTAPPAATRAPIATPTACRGAIPTSSAALQGPLRKPIGPTSTAVIWYVVDGDTIRLTNKDYVRLIGMDTPETVKPGTPVQPYGPQASADLKALLAGHTAVVLERDISNTDFYGRLLRFVWIKNDATWYQLDYELVVRGDARLDTIKPDVRYASDFAAAQGVAQAHHVGRWATC
jgi:endonuclease YncB( thermonuclease family)